jgi:hypothetical protein
MSKAAHSIYITSMAAIVMLTIFLLIYRGLSYYSTNLESRYFHPDNNLLKPSGFIGHGLGIAGTFFILAGVGLYMARKRYRFLFRLGILKHWLEFHIFLCTLGPVLILFHTAYKIGGLVAVSFWSMVAVFLSGIIGRFIYIQIPRSREGRELSLSEVRGLKSDVAAVLRASYNLNEESYNVIINSVKTRVEIYTVSGLAGIFRNYFEGLSSVRTVRRTLKRNKLPLREYNKIMSLVKEDITLRRKIAGLDTMQNFFRYWHVIHSPFALIMIIIMFIHVGVAIAFGYKWIL